MAFSRFFGRGRDTSRPSGRRASRTTSEDGVVRRGRRVGSTRRARGRRPASWRERAEAAAPHRRVDRQQARRGTLGRRPADDLPTHFVSARGCRIVDVHGTHVPRLHHGARLGRTRLRRAARHAGRRRCRVARATSPRSRAGARWKLAERLRTLIPCAETRAVAQDRRRGDVGRGASRAHVHGARSRGRERLLRLARLGVRLARGVPRSGAQRQRSRVPVRRRRRTRARGADGGRRRSPPSCSNRSSSAARPMRGFAARASSPTRVAQSSIFDEMKTGFRVAPGGYQEVCGITPDLADVRQGDGERLSALRGRRPCGASWMRRATRGSRRHSRVSRRRSRRHSPCSSGTRRPTSAPRSPRRVARCAPRSIAPSRRVASTGVSTVGIDPMFLLRWDDPDRESATSCSTRRAPACCSSAARTTSPPSRTTRRRCARSRRRRAVRSSRSRGAGALSDVRELDDTQAWPSQRADVRSASWRRSCCSSTVRTRSGSSTRSPASSSAPAAAS